MFVDSLLRPKIIVLNHCQLKFPKLLKCCLNMSKIFIIKADFIQVTKNSEWWRILTIKDAKNISTNDFSILHTTIPYNLLVKVVSEIIHFVFKSKVCSKIGFSATSIPKD